VATPAATAQDRSHPERLHGHHVVTVSFDPTRECERYSGIDPAAGWPMQIGAKIADFLFMRRNMRGMCVTPQNTTL
jgi:hypothetical protein